MKYLFDEEGLKTLERFCGANTLFAFDFDGTLARLSADYMQRRMSRRAQAAFATLNERAATAIITGRSVAHVTPLLGLEPDFVIGNHGAEGLKDYVLPECVPAQLRAWQEALEPLSIAGVRLNTKPCSLTLHYASQDTKEKIRSAISSLEPVPRTLSGKGLINLIPPGLPHKGDALLKLMEQSGCPHALFAGDEETDEDVFTLRNPFILSVKIGKSAFSSADYYLRRQSEVPRLLETILHSWR